MKMPDLVTIAGVVGPGDTQPSKQFSDVVDIDINLAKQVLTLFRSGGQREIYLDLFGIATVTYTVSSHLATISFS
jgi:hypothetical protein